MAKLTLDWPVGKPPLGLGEGEVHVWAWCLDLPSDRLAALAAVLSPDERERAGQFRLDQLRQRFIAGRGGMRVLLADYLHASPGALEFDYASRGKPTLAGDAAGKLHFNLSHSHGVAVLAVTQFAALGVDVEKVRPMPNALEIAERFFAAAEVATLKNVPPGERDEAFFRLWTCKEAWLKATGDGIAASLSKVEMAFLPEEQPGVLAIDGDSNAGRAWSICQFIPAAGFVGAVAIAARDLQISCWRAEF